MKEVYIKSYQLNNLKWFLNIHNCKIGFVDTLNGWSSNDLDFVFIELIGLPNLPRCIVALNEITKLKLILDKRTIKLSLLHYLQYLDISGNNRKSISKHIGRCNTLEELIIQYNRLKKIPKSINNLSNLVKLSLSNKKMEKIPKCIFKLVKQKYLYLNNNFIIKVSNKIGNLVNLIELNLNRNKIRKLPKTICRLTLLIIN
jgi:Leucine-rich repeat (LRR) protein